VEAYDPGLGSRPSLVVGTKADLVPEDAPLPAGFGLAVSALSGRTMEELGRRLRALVAKAVALEPERAPYVVIRPARESFAVRREGKRYRVSGPRVERWVAEADLDDPRQVADLQRRLVRAGVERRLAQAGARRGDEVLIGDQTFQYIPEGMAISEDASGGEPADDGEREPEA
jgi:GTP-binding protein